MTDAAPSRPAGSPQFAAASTSAPAGGRVADWNSRGLGTLTAGVTQAIERNLTKETTRKEASMEEVTEEDIAAFRCSLLGRRFPALRVMKQEQLRELILDSRRATGKKLPVEPRRWPKSREHLVSRLAFTHSDASGRCKGAPAGRHHDKVVRAVVCKPGEARAPQRANPVWQTTGKVYDGRRDWVATGRLAARDGMDRNARQRFLADTAHVSEFARTHDCELARETAAKARWLDGDLRPANWAEAREAVRGKATLTSHDEATLVRELRDAVDRGHTATQTLRSQTRAARGRMLHAEFPAASTGIAAGAVPSQAAEAADAQQEGQQEAEGEG